MLYLKVLNPERTSYGISDHLFAITQLAQTTLRSEVGKIDLDRTFEERTNINIAVVGELDKATEPWGVKVLRYEIKNITPPADILAAMEKQMRAEREKRAVILTSEGQRDAAINSAEGEKQQVIKASEARASSRSTRPKARRRRSSRWRPPRRRASGEVADAIQTDGGVEAVQLRVAEQYVDAVRQAGKEDERGGRAGQPRRRVRHDCHRDAGIRSRRPERAERPDRSVVGSTDSCSRLRYFTGVPFSMAGRYCQDLAASTTLRSNAGLSGTTIDAESTDPLSLMMISIAATAARDRRPENGGTDLADRDRGHDVHVVRFVDRAIRRPQLPACLEGRFQFDGRRDGRGHGLRLGGCQQRHGLATPDRGNPSASSFKSDRGGWLPAVPSSGSASPSSTILKPSAALAYSFCSNAARAAR